MAVISAMFVDRIARAAGAEGLDCAALLFASGVDPRGPVDPKKMVPAALHYALWESILRTLPENAAGFPIRYAQTLTVDDYGAFGLAAKTAVDVRDALQRCVRYLLVLTNTSRLTLDEGEPAFFTFHRESPRQLGTRCANEAAVAEMLNVMRQITGRPLVPRCIHHRHAAPEDIAEHRAFYQCELRFNADRDAIEFDRAVLSVPIVKADVGLSTFLIGHLEELLDAVDTAPSLPRAMLAVISDELPGGPPKMDAVARKLGMSARTMHRRLAAQGTRYQDVVDAIRQDLARSLLAKSSHPLADVAFLTGFSEQSAFTRAFKRWTGQTPAAFRDATIGA